MKHPGGRWTRASLVTVLGLSTSACVATARGGVGYSGGPTSGHVEGNTVLGAGFGDVQDSIVVDVGAHGGEQNLVAACGVEYRHQPPVDAEGVHRLGVRARAAGGYAGAGKGLASAGGAAESELGILVRALDQDDSRLFVSLGGTAGYRFASTLAGPYGGVALGVEWYSVVLRGVPGLR